MASVTSLMNSTNSTSSLYGNRNVISGLASGMDTEAMITNSISGYKSKITSLQQKMTKMQWKQDAYRSLITQMNNILSKYTSFTSSTNLFSASFFSKAVNTVANGANAAAVSAVGKSSSNVAINSIKQLAEAASYTVGTGHLVSEGSKTESIQWNEKVETSNVSGSISIKYGGGKEGKGSTFTLRFDESEVYKTPDELAKAINEKLKEKNVTTSGGSQSADNYIEAVVDNGRVVLKDKKDNYFAITSVSGGMGELFEKGEASKVSDDGKRGFASKAIATYDADGNLLNGGVDLIDDSKTTFEYLKDKTINVTLDGKTKQIKLGDVMNSEAYKKAEGKGKSPAFRAGLQAALDEAFGEGKIKVSANSAPNSLKFTDGDGKDFAKGTVFKVSGSSDIVNNALGLGEGGYSNTLQTGWTLEKALGSKAADIFTTPVNAKDKNGNIKAAIVDGMTVPVYLDKDGKETTNVDEAQKVGVININGKNIEVKSTDTVKDMMEKINASDAGVEIKYSSMTGNFAITSKDTGAASKVDIGGKLGEALFGKVENGTSSIAGATYKNGKDAEFEVTINGETMRLTRSSNTVDLDGMQVTLKNAFGTVEDATAVGGWKTDPAAEKITFTTSSDSDKIVDAVKAFVEDYNKLVTELHNSYRTEALKNSSGKSYEPLTDDDLSGMSESSIKAYEEKAKTGILFGDQDLSNLYRKLTESVQSSGAMGAAFRSIGLNVSFSNGLSTLTLDEEALRSALDEDPDKVKNAFTQSTANGAAQDGLMAGLKNTLEMYGNTSIANPGILVNKAGTELSSYSLSHNEMQDQLDSIQEQIERWQDKMSDRVDFYTNKFTQLEMLINQMNSQSSMLSGMMGGY